MNYSELYLLEDPFSNRWLRLDPVSEWLTIDNSRQLAYGQWKPPEPVVFKGYMGGPTADILRTGLPPLICVSQKVINLLEGNHFTGWATYPVEVSDRKGNNLPDFFGFAVTSFAGERELSRSQIIEKEPIVTGGSRYKVYKGFYFNENKWDGSDIFRVHPSWLIVTKAVRDSFVKAKIRNVEFITLLDEETSVSAYS
jgi:hypothetical protein